jgi:hypothetical protein
MSVDVCSEAGSEERRIWNVVAARRQALGRQFQGSSSPIRLIG